jgi:NitT/TauT family transport system permease protein
MSAVPVNRNSGLAAEDLASADETAIAADIRNRTHRRKTLLWTARLATLVIIVGGWQLLVNAKIIDPFFWGKPSGIVTQLKNWVQNGTAYGSIWLQIWTTFKEAVLGFVIGREDLVWGRGCR